MMKAKAITAGAIALTLTLGGGSLWASQYANAATAVSTQSTQSTSTETGTNNKDHAGNRGGFGHGIGQIQEQLLTFLSLDEEALQTKLETLTLAEVALEQGITRDELKAQLVEWLEAAQAEAPEPAAAETDEQATDADGNVKEKPDIATIAEKLLDSQGFGLGKEGGSGGKGFGRGSAEIAAALGLTEDELKTETEAGKTLAAIAAEQGVDVQTIIDAEVSAVKVKLDEQLADGKVTQEEYDAKLLKATESATNHVNAVLPERSKDEGLGGRGGEGFGGGFDTIAEVLGLTVDELKAEIEAGKTIAAIAAEQGVDVQDIIDAQVAAMQEKLDEQLAAGTITQEQYDTKLTKATEHATNHVNGVLPERGEGNGPGGQGGKGPRGERTDATDASASDTTETEA